MLLLLLQITMPIAMILLTMNMTMATQPKKINNEFRRGACKEGDDDGNEGEVDDDAVDVGNACDHQGSRQQMLLKPATTCMI